MVLYKKTVLLTSKVVGSASKPKGYGAGFHEAGRKKEGRWGGTYETWQMGQEGRTPNTTLQCPRGIRGSPPDSKGGLFHRQRMP